MARTLAQVFVELRARGDDLERDVDRAARNAGGSLQDQMGRAGDEGGRRAGRGISTGLKAAAGAFAAGAGLALIKDSITAASDLAETTSKLQVVFGPALAAQVEAFGATAAQALGQSSAQALSAAGTFGGLLTSMGLAQPEAAKISTEFVKLASDMASFNNASPEETLAALKSALVGENDPLKQFGVVLNAAAVQQAALASGLIKTGEALTPATTAQATYTEIMRLSAQQQGDFGRTSEGLANQQRILTAQWADAKAQLGEVLLPTVLKVVTGFKDFVDFVKENKDVLGPLAIAIGAVTVATLALNFALYANPITLIAVGLAALAAGFIVAYKRSETFRNVIGAVVDVVKVYIRTVVKVIGGIADVWFTVVGAILRGAAAAFGWVPGVGDKLKGARDAFDGLHEKVNSTFDGIANSAALGGQQAGQGLADGIAASTPAAEKAARDARTRILGIFGSLYGANPPVPTPNVTGAPTAPGGPPGAAKPADGKTQQQRINDLVAQQKETLAADAATAEAVRRGLIADPQAPARLAAAQAAAQQQRDKAAADAQRARDKAAVDAERRATEIKQAKQAAAKSLADSASRLAPTNAFASLSQAKDALGLGRAAGLSQDDLRATTELLAQVNQRVEASRRLVASLPGQAKAIKQGIADSLRGAIRDDDVSGAFDKIRANFSGTLKTLNMGNERLSPALAKVAAETNKLLADEQKRGTALLDRRKTLQDEEKTFVSKLTDLYQQQASAAAGYAAALTKGTGLLDAAARATKAVESVAPKGSGRLTVLRAASGPVDLTSSGLISAFTAGLSDLRGFAASIGALQAGGLAADLVRQIVEAGPEQGAATAKALASDPNAIAQANRLNAEIKAASAGVADQLAQQDYRPQLDLANQQLDVNLQQQEVTNAALDALPALIGAAVADALAGAAKAASTTRAADPRPRPPARKPAAPRRR